MKNVRKKLLSILLTIIMIVTALPLTASAEDTVPVIEVSTAEELTAACNTINDSGGTYTISMKADFTGSVSINNPNAVVTLVGNGHTLSHLSNFVNVLSGTLNLGDGKSELTLKGGVDPSLETLGSVYIAGSNSYCNMYDKVTIRDNVADNNFGGGVSVQGGTFHMYGGTIYNCGIATGSVCYGGGVGVYSGGTFIMDDGIISECYARSEYIDDQDPYRCFTAMGGGVFVTQGSSFTMNGGTISNCDATNFGGGIALAISYDEMVLKGFGMGRLKSAVIINGGTICNNQAGNGAGVFASGYFYADAAVIQGYDYGNIGNQPNPGLYINSGEISQNTAYESGGGVFIAMLRPNKVMLHNATITGNSAYDGAGVNIYGYWTNTDIDDCVITNNTAETNGGGIELIANSSGGKTSLKDTVITGNTSGDRGAGVYYDENSKLTISGANIIQNNTYNGADNNLNICGKDYPVYVDSALTGSQIGLSDPKLWDDGLSDTAQDATSEDYLTSGYKTYNGDNNPSSFFTSDHESWYADYSDVNTNEVRLVRRENEYKVVFHENNPMLGNKNVVFKTYQSSNTGMKIDHFYDIPAWAGDEYVFAGWYHNNDYSKSPDEATIPVDFENDTYSPHTSGTDYHIYAKWIPVGTVGKDTKDANIFDGDYRGFGLVGVQIREPEMYDDNYEKQTPGGMRFVTSLKESLISEIDDLSTQTVDNVDVEYGYAVGTEQNINAFIEHYGITDTANYELQYKGENVNGVDTNPEKGSGTAATDFRYITNVNCTKGITNSDGTIKKDHRNFTDYRLYTLVVTYEGDSADKKNEKIDARAYIRYYDANNKLRVFYNDYKKDTYYGGCLCSFNQVEGMAIPQDPDLLEEQQRPEG